MSNSSPAVQPGSIDPELAAALNHPYRVDPLLGESVAETERRRRREWHIVRRVGRPPLGREAIVSGVRCRIFAPRAATSLTMIWLHGGGWQFGEPEGDEQMLQRIADEAGVRVVGVDYRLAPEHPYPAALDDVITVYHALTGQGPVLLAGASAGATLAAGACLRIRDQGHRQPVGQMLICPPLENESTDDEPGPLRRADMDEFWSAYLQAQMPDGYAVPALAGSLADLPPTYVFTTSTDPLRLEGWRFAMRLAADGVEVTAQFLPGGHHGFEYEAPDASLSRRMVGEWANVVRRFAPQPDRTPQAREGTA